MRPNSIATFERLFFISLAISVALSFLNHDALLAQLATEPSLAKLNLGNGFLFAVYAIALLCNLLLWFLIARKGSNIARWVFLALTAYGFLNVPNLFLDVFTLAKGVGLIDFLLSIAMIYFLFRPDAREWFARKAPTDQPTDQVAAD